MSLQLDARIIVVAVNASSVAGGEAYLPLQYFTRVAARGVDVWLVTHDRNRSNLQDVASDYLHRVRFVPDTATVQTIGRLGRVVPVRVKSLTIWPLMGALTSLALRKVVRRLVQQAPGSVVVHEPTGVSPRTPSFMTGTGAPVVSGPLNGAMSYPPGFAKLAGRDERLARWSMRRLSRLANGLARGKSKATIVLVANQRTRTALPRSVRATRIRLMVENGVDVSLFSPEAVTVEDPAQFLYVGRLVDWKRVDLLIKAIHESNNCNLIIVGSGPEKSALEKLAGDLKIVDKVRFAGQLSHEEIAELMHRSLALVLPSVYESGGAVVLEAMASGIPVVATNWGGPTDYVVDGVTGLLIEPTGPVEMVGGLATAMQLLSTDRLRAQDLGTNGRAVAERDFNWERKIDRMLEEIYPAAIRANMD